MLTVRVPEWELEDSRRILSVGDQLRAWLTFQEAERWPSPAERINVIEGTALPLSAWPGAERGRHPVQINLDGGALYWDAPHPVAGALEVTGTVSTNNVDAPDGFPDTSGVLRRLRMEWQDFIKSTDRVWHNTGESARYEEVTTTYFPTSDTDVLDPDAESELSREAREAFDRELAAGRLKAGDPFEVTLRAPGSSRDDPPGSTRTRWTGILIDLEIAHPTGG
jgi:hypothetical protein